MSFSLCCCGGKTTGNTDDKNNNVEEEGESVSFEVFTNTLGSYLENNNGKHSYDDIFPSRKASFHLEEKPAFLYKMPRLAKNDFPRKAVSRSIW